MGRKIDVNNLIDAQGIADLFGVHRTLVHKWRDRDLNFPEPLDARLTKTLVWNWPEVEAWGKATGRLDANGQPVKRRED